MLIRTVIAVVIVATMAGYPQVAPKGETSFNGFSLVDKAGNIRKPADYRDKYETLGTWMVLDPKGNQMHVTYASPGAAEYYRLNKKFADGTVLVKEINGTEHAQLTTGDAHWASGTKVWFILVKDERVISRITLFGETAGDGLSTNPMHQTSRWPPITTRTALAVTCLRRRQAGYTFKVTPF
jgi:Cytochrome P460